jgi:hypothetical protein
VSDDAADEPPGNSFIAPLLSFSDNILTFNQRWKSAELWQALFIRDEPSQEE